MRARYIMDDHVRLLSNSAFIIASFCCHGNCKNPQFSNYLQNLLSLLSLYILRQFHPGEFKIIIAEKISLCQVKNIPKDEFFRSLHFY